MKNKLIYLLIIIIFGLSPFSVIADGGVVKPLPEGDWTWVDENSQQAFINYEQGTEKLIVAVDIKKENSDIAWILPVASKPEKIKVDITSELPFFFGDNVISKAKLIFSESLKLSYPAALLGQIWTLPFGTLLAGTGAAHGGSSGKMPAGDLVSVETHLQKAGMVTEVIAAKNGQAIYNYFSQKGFNIKQGSISELNSYIDKDYSFVVSWIASKTVAEEDRGQRGIFVSFPISKIYYPLILTSAYGTSKIPIVVRVLNHVKPKIFSEIKPYTKVSYFAKRTKGGSDARCMRDIYNFRVIMVLYNSEHYRYPFSLQELKEDTSYGDEAKTLLKDMNKYCCSSPWYYSKGKDDYSMAVMLSSGRIYVVDSSGFAGEKELKKTEIVPLELQKFYGNKKPWKGDADYTKITINAPARLLKKDLWMKSGRPFKISSALWAANNPLIVTLFLYLLIVGIVSFIAGGLAGLLCFGKFKKYALIGLSNVLTLIGLILIFNYLRKKRGEDVRRSRFNFIFSFSVIFIFLLVFPFLALLSIEEGKELWVLPTLIIGIGLPLAILLLINFLLGKIGLKNETIRVILTIILSVIFWIAAFFLFFYWLEVI